MILTYLGLEAAEEQNFQTALAKIPPQQERQEFMQIMTRWERRALQKGIEQGRRDGEVDLVLELLVYRFGKLMDISMNLVQKLSETQLKELAKALFGFSGPDDLTAWLGRNVQN